MLVGWGILSPLSKYSGWAPGPVGDMTTGARGWILWVSLAIMCADSLVSLMPVIYEIISEKLLPSALYHKLSGRAQDHGEDREVETEDRLVPMKWVWWGLGVSIVLGTFLVWVVFGQDGITPWATVIGYIVGALLSVLGYVFCFGMK